MALIDARSIVKTFASDGGRLSILHGITITIEKGEFVSIVGQSGSGKTTLMNILGCLDIATSGTYLFDGIDIATQSLSDLARIRNKKIGFVFQQFNVLPDLTALDNVMLPQLYANVTTKEARARAKELLERMDLASRMHHYPNQLSGGQQQRVSIARALVNDPMLILADEPTGNLDSQTGSTVFELFQQLHAMGTTIIIVTHDRELAGKTNRIISLRDGMVISDTTNR